MERLHLQVPVIIRPAQAADSAGIAQVHVASWQQAYRGIVPQLHLDQLSTSDRERRWDGILQLESSETLVAEVEGQIAGFISYGSPQKGDDPTQAGQVHALYVAEPHWSRGVGRALWTAAATRLRALGFDRAFVWVLAENARALRFYQREGFKLCRNSATTVEIGGMALPQARYEVPL